MGGKGNIFWHAPILQHPGRFPYHVLPGGSQPINEKVALRQDYVDIGYPSIIIATGLWLRPYHVCSRASDLDYAMHAPGGAFHRGPNPPARWMRRHVHILGSRHTAGQPCLRRLIAGAGAGVALVLEASATLEHASQSTTLGTYSHAFVGGLAFSASMSKVMKRRRDASEG
jgi:hypothetical protein